MLPVTQHLTYCQPVAYQQPVSYQPLPPYTVNGYQAPGNGCNSFLWFLALIFFAWPLALMVCILYVLASPFAPCYECMAIIADALLVAVKLPYTCSQNMIRKTPFC